MLASSKHSEIEVAVNKAAESGDIDKMRDLYKIKIPGIGLETSKSELAGIEKGITTIEDEIDQKYDPQIKKLKDQYPGS